MYKKIFSAILFGVITIASTSTFVSCKDYDDDIKNLQEQINDLVNTKIATINTTITTLQSNLTAIENGYKEGDKQTLASAEALIKSAIADLKSTHDKDVATLTAKDAELDAAIVKANQRIDDVIKLLSDQDGNIQQVGKDLKNLSDKLSDFESKYGTLSTAFGELTTRVTNLEDAVKAQKAALDELAKAIGNGTNPTGIDDATLKADIAKAGERIDELEKKISDLDTKLTKQINDAVTTVNGKIDGVNTDLQGLKTEYTTFATTVTNQISVLDTTINGVKAQAEATAADLGKLDVMFKLLVNDLRSLVYMPKLYIDGIETIEYPYLRMALLDRRDLTPIQRVERDDNVANFDNLTNDQYTIKNLQDYIDVTVNDSIAYGPVWPVEYHMNPGNASTEFESIMGWYAYESEVLTRAFYDTKNNAASTYGFTPRRNWDNQYEDDNIWNKTNGIMTLGLQITKPESIDNPGMPGTNHFPSDLTEDARDGQSPESVYNVIAALQARSSKSTADYAGAGKDTIITSDYAQIVPEKVKIEGLIWRQNPTYWKDNGLNENPRVKDFWENKKGYGNAAWYSTCATYDGGVAYKYRTGDGSATNGRDEQGFYCQKWVHVWDTPDEAMVHPADIELYTNKDVVLSEYLGVHWYFDQNEPITKNVADHKNIQTWKYNDPELRRYGFVWVFDTVDYYLEKNETYDSRYAIFTDHKNGTIRAKNVDELGKTAGIVSHSAVDREPLVRVRLYHFSNIADMKKWQNIDAKPEGIAEFNQPNYKPVLDGYIRLHITRPELLEITDYKYEFRPTFDLCNDWPTAFTQPLDQATPKGHYTTWAQFDAWVLQKNLKNMEKAQFDAAYNPELDLLGAPESTLPFNGGQMREMIQYSKPTSSSSLNEYYHYKNLSTPAPVKSNPIKATDKIGRIYQIYDADGTTNHAYAWKITAEEMEALTHDQEPWNKKVTIERYIHYTGHFYSSTDPNNTAAYYDDIFIKLTMIIDRAEVPTSVTSKRDENYWYNWEGSWTPYWKQEGTDRLQSIANNTPYPENDGRTVPWRNNILKTWDANKVNIKTTSNSPLNVTTTAASKFYFAPFEYEIKALDGTVYVVTPKRGSGDNIYNKFICKYWNETHAYKLDQTNPFNSTELEKNNDIMKQCAIRYQPDVDGIQKAYGMTVATVADASAWPKADGVFSNDTLYAYKKSPTSEASKPEYEPIAIIINTSTGVGGGQVVLLHEYVENKWLTTNDQPSGNKYTLPNEWDKENAYAEACVNAVGYKTKILRDEDGLMTGEFEDQGNPLKDQLRSYVGVVATSICNIANQMNDNRTKNYTVFQMPWERPINFLQENDHMIDAINNSDYIYLVDLIKLYDWRGVNEGHMWGDTPNYWGKTWEPWQWLWAYYNVKSISVDLRTSSVLTNLSDAGADGRKNNFVKLSTVSNEVLLTAKGSASYVTFDYNDFGSVDPNFPLRTAPTNFNANTKNQDLINYMGLNNPDVEPGPDPDKARFGYIRYENNGQNVHDFEVKVPVSIVYDWGRIFDQPITIHIHYTRGNN